YTWSHSIDNQSEPLAGEFDNLTYANSSGAAAPTIAGARFTQETNSRADRGNSDFDQRHNFILTSAWSLPTHRSKAAALLFRGWQVSELAALRAGMPFT